MQRKWQAYQTDRNCTENGRPIRRKKSKKEKSKKMDIIQKISEDLSLKKKQVEVKETPSPLLPAIVRS